MEKISVDSVYQHHQNECRYIVKKIIDPDTCILQSDPGGWAFTAHSVKRLPGYKICWKKADNGYFVDIPYYDGKPFWSGSFSLETWEIEETYTYSEAYECDFHLLYFSVETEAKLNTGKSVFFYFDDKNIQIYFVKESSGMTDKEQEILDAIMEKIIIRKGTYEINEVEK